MFQLSRSCAVSSCLLCLLLVSIFLMYTEINRKHTEPSTGNQQRYMTEGVGNIEPSTAGWVANSRLIPAAFPAKSVSDWDYRTGPLTEARHFEEEFFSCPFSNHAEAAPVYRYKYFDGTWYSDREHLEIVSGNKLPYSQYREPFVAALLFAAWLYKDFPHQMDFAADFSDLSRGCENVTVLPFMKYSSLDLGAVSATADGNNFLRYDASSIIMSTKRRLLHVKEQLLQYSPQMKFKSVDNNLESDFGMLKAPCQEESASRVHGRALCGLSSNGPSSTRLPLSITQLPNYLLGVTFNRGFVMPTPEAWSQFCYNQSQLENYVTHINEKHPWASKKGAVFWRGSTNGEQYLYPEDLGLKTPHDDAEQDRSSWQSRRRRPRSVFGSKRAMMALMAHPFSFFDVGIMDPETLKDIWHPAIAEVIQKPRVELSQWGAYSITVSIDGWGPPYRLPFQILGGSVTLAQKSPYVTWLEAYKNDLWRPGVHYESFEYDLSDFVVKAREVVHRPREQLQAMAEASQKSGVQLLNVFSMLDSIMWSLMRIKEVSQWKVRPPKPGSVWKVVKMKKGEWCKFAHGIPSAVKSAMEERFASNFLPDELHLFD
jgi:hypothetical protein